MEIDYRRVVDALPGLVWTALPDGRIDFLNQRWCEYTGLGVDEALWPGVAGCDPPRRPAPSCSNAGDPFWLPASPVKWRRASGTSMESIAGFSSVLVRWPTRPDRSSNGAE